MLVPGTQHTAQYCMVSGTQHTVQYCMIPNTVQYWSLVHNTQYNNGPWYNTGPWSGGKTNTKGHTTHTHAGC